MSTPKSTQGSSPRTDVYTITPRSDSSIENGEQRTTAKRVTMISTPGSSHGITPRTISSSAEEGDDGSPQGQSSKEQKEQMTTGEMSPSFSSEFRVGTQEKSSSSSIDSSRKTASLGEVEEHVSSSSLMIEELEDGSTTLLNGENFLAANLDTVLDGFEIFDPQEREEIRKSLSEEADSSEAFEAVEKQLERENGLAGQLAKLFDQYLHELSVQHEDHNKELEMDLATWKSRCEELENSLEHEKQHWQSHFSTKLTKTHTGTSRINLISWISYSNIEERLAICKSNQVLDLEQARDELEITHGMIKNHKEQLEQKDEQLRIYRESIDALESMWNEEKERQTELANGYEELTKDTRQTLSRVIVVNKQLRLLKNDTSKYHLQGHTNDQEVKELHKKLEHQNAVNHKLGVELAAHRRRSSSTKSKENECKGCECLLEWKKQAQLLQGCIPALVAQVLELKDRLRMVGASDLVPSNDKHTTNLNLNCSDELVPASDSYVNCLHEFVPLSNMNGKGAMSDKDIHLVSHQFHSTASPRTQVENALKLVERETITKLEGHAKLAKKMEFLQRKLGNCKEAIGKSKIELSRSGATVEHLRYELRKSQETNRELEAKLQKRAETRKKSPTDCMRIKELLDNIEKLEMENTLLKHEVMVQNDKHIARLERELQKVRHGNTVTTDNTRKSDTTRDWEKVISDMESTIVSKDSLILELRFEVDQATWKLDQVEKRFDILFGALDCKTIELNSPIVDSMLEDIFSSEKLNSPALNLLKEKVLARRGHFRSGNREKELEGLVEDLVKVVEKVSHDNEKLRRTCEDTVKHMEKNKELRKVVEDLQSQIAKGGQSLGRDRPNSAQAALITDLKSQLSDLADANAGLLRVLRETEGQCSGLKQMVQEQFMEDKQSVPQQDKEGFRKSRRICFSEHEHKKQDKQLQSQADKINKLEQQVATQNQVINDLNDELERKDNELDLVHGQLSIKMLSDQSENIQQSRDLWSFSTTADTRYRDDTKQTPEDFSDNQYLVEHDHELTQAENQRLRKFVVALKNPELLEEIRDLKAEHQRMAKVCDRYEELLGIYSRQLGVPFSSLRERF